MSKEELCIHCLSEPTGLCGLHKPKPISFEDAFAIACEHACQIGLLERVDETTCRMNLKL